MTIKREHIDHSDNLRLPENRKMASAPLRFTEKVEAGTATLCARGTLMIDGNGKTSYRALAGEVYSDVRILILREFDSKGEHQVADIEVTLPGCSESFRLSNIKIDDSRSWATKSKK